MIVRIQEAISCPWVANYAEDLALLEANGVTYVGGEIIPQKCDLPEENVYKILFMLEMYGFIVDLKMVTVGRFNLECN